MKIKLIAEIGCNHQGMYAQAIEMIKIIKKYCDVDHVKFQKRNITHLTLMPIILSAKRTVYTEKS